VVVGCFSQVPCLAPFCDDDMPFLILASPPCTVQVKVRKIGQAVEQEVKVAAVCLDADVALLSCSAAGFWDDLEAVSLEVELPALQVRQGTGAHLPHDAPLIVTRPLGAPRPLPACAMPTRTA